VVSTVLRSSKFLAFDSCHGTRCARLFRDCVLGAVPPVGPCYGLDVIVDDSIQEQPDVYLEGGDHVTLVHMSSAQFARLTAGAPHGRFSVHMA